MLTRFIDYIHKEHLLAEGQRVLLAVSGGRDSVVMCELMSQAGYGFSIAHCNFNLRPGDCDRDESFVRALAKKYGVDIYVSNFNTVDYAKEKSLSIEEAARELRYAFFEKIRREEGHDAIATAHHRDDAIETFFINLMRGAGIMGLQGIRPRNGFVIRPMLAFCRNDINAFIKDKHLDYVEDYTNAEPLYLRNRIRLQLMPLLRDMAPSFDKTMQSNLEHLSDAAEIYSDVIEKYRSMLLHRNSDETYSIDIKALRSIEPYNTVLFELLHPFGFSATVMPEIVKVLEGESGKRFYSDSYILVKDRIHLLLYPRIKNDDKEFIIEGPEITYDNKLPICLSVEDATSGQVRLSPEEAWFDCDKLCFPLILRHWHHGDRFVPFGMKNKKLLSDFFTDIKLDVEQKRRVWVLCDAEGQVLWVVGYRAANVAIVNSSTKNILKMAVKH